MGKLEFFHSSSRGRITTPEIDSHRPYAQGEDPRYIDWNLFARLDRFFLKTVVTEEEGILHLVVDTSSSMRRPYDIKHRTSLEITAGIAYLLLSSGNQLAIHSCSDRIVQSRGFDMGEQDTQALLHYLSTITVGNETNLGRALTNLSNIQRGHNVRTIIISDLIDLGGYIQQLNILQTRGIKVGAIQILHPEEIRPRFRGNIRFVDPETGQRNKQLIGYRKLRSMREAVSRFHLQTNSAFEQYGIPFLRVSSQFPFEKAVIQFMSKPGWRGKS
jgi:uncharacterized protein (DUF58 family)